MSTPQPDQQRWPLHPCPAQDESLSSWLDRIGQTYGLSGIDLVRLGPTSVRSDLDPDALDWDPPPAVLTALGARSGTPLAQLRRMTMAGWVPWLTDTLDAAGTQQAVFDTYVRQESVLLLAGEAGRHRVRRSWTGPWLPARPLCRACPICASDPRRGTALMWRLPIMTGCGVHGCRFEPGSAAMASAMRSTNSAAVPVHPHVAALDRCSHEGLTTGTVTLPGRVVHVAVWFRLLRTLLDELSIAPSSLGTRSRAMLEQIWQAAGHPARAGITTWRPYELLSWPRQEMLLHAAATALHLTGTGTITARGTLSAALTTQPHRPVHGGDAPTTAKVPASTAMRLALEAWITATSTNSRTARQIRRRFSYPCRTQAQFQSKRADLINLGVPEQALPHHLSIASPEPSAASGEEPATLISRPGFRVVDGKTPVGRRVVQSASGICAGNLRK